MTGTAHRRSSTKLKRPGRRLLNHDRNLGVRFVAGADEVGRGCLAGPLVVAAVAFDYQALVGPAASALGHLDDSKRVPPATRERLYAAIISAAASFSIVLVSPETIDRVGLHRSNVDALCRALRTLRSPVDVALVDGFDVGDMPMECRRIVRGDSTSACIAAASILAKVTRDRLMERLDTRFDHRWGFSEHVGYATPLHHERIAEHGVSPLHRRSFDSAAYTDDMWRDLDAELDALPPATPRALTGSEGVGHVFDPLDGPASIAEHEEHVASVPVDITL